VKLDKLKAQIIADVIGIEGEYSDHPHDSGGKTMLGITEYVAKKHGFAVEKLTNGQAVSIYQTDFWQPLCLDQIVILSESITHELFDTGVNMGVSRAAEYLQRSLNVLNQQSRYYNDLKVDGEIGDKTINALKKYLNKRGKKGKIVLLKMLNALQGSFYVRLAERREKDESFVFGWFDNRIT
jgi:lysozyme family protein